MGQLLGFAVVGHVLSKRNKVPGQGREGGG